jgi:hypothetical protein
LLMKVEVRVMKYIIESKFGYHTRGRAGPRCTQFDGKRQRFVSGIFILT